MTTITYQGFQASVELDEGAVFVKVLNVADLLMAECEALDDAAQALKDLVDAYREDCLVSGRLPDLMS